MGKSSKKRERTDEDVADNHDAKPVVKKSKLDSTGKAEVTKKSSKVKEPKPEPVATEDAPGEAPKAKKEKKDKKDRKEKKDKKEKKEKKSKSKEDTAATPESDEPAPAAAPSEEAEPSEAKEAATNGINGTNGTADSTDKKSKKKSKKDKKKKSSKTDDTPTNGEATTTTNGETNGETNGDDTNETTTANGKPNRFICFVGNLPYSATADAVRAHFATLQPTSVRLLTQRDDPSKSRGIAFVEFAGYDHMKTCLKKFHHTEFEEPGAKGPPRRINVELTYVFTFPCTYFPCLMVPRKECETNQLLLPMDSAGGGGKTAARQDKIKQKNAKLNEERANRMQREEEAKLEKAATGGGGGGKTQEQRDEDSIHPSRRARVPYGKN
jgi:nucleolar protein 6